MQTLAAPVGRDWRQEGELGGADHVYGEWVAREGWLTRGLKDTRAALGYELSRSWEDHRRYYARENLAELALGIALAAPLANTSADRRVRDWYQRKARSDVTDHFADVLRYGGEYWVAVPVCVGAALSGTLTGDGGTDSAIPAWGNRSLRALLVGVPPLAGLSAALGAARPSQGDSRWQPFHDHHGISGHTFVAAVPFLTAAHLTEDPFWRGTFVLGSFLTGWSRINDDRHYVSQVALGWWVAYLAVASVNEAETGQRWLRIIPSYASGGPGVAVWVQY